jgi:hypothetical protein
MSDGFDCFGTDEELGFDTSALLQGAGGLASGVMAQVKDDQAKNKVSADESKKLANAIAADIVAVTAAAKADTTAPKVGRATGVSATADAAAAKIAASAADKAAAGLSADSQQKRADAADKALAASVAALQKSPSNEYQAALVTEWTAQANKAHSGSISASDDGSADDSGGGKKGKGGKGKKGADAGGSILTRPVLGPVPLWGVLVGGAGILGVVGVVVKKMFFKHVGGS